MFRLSREGIGGILLDIEGTTTSIAFVYDVLFPFARRHAARYLADHIDSPNVCNLIHDLEVEHAQDERKGANPPPWPESAEDTERAGIYACWLMDQDRKSTPLKTLQGLIWQEGYRTGELRAHVFPDIPAALSRWLAHGLITAIFSSGSVLAQRLLFGGTLYGNLTPLITGYFDTTTGSKTDPMSYDRIAGNLGIENERLLFISDRTAELDAANRSRLRTLLCVRPGNAPQPSGAHFTISSFDEIGN